jgi:hypothetical protein
MKAYKVVAQQVGQRSAKWVGSQAAAASARKHFNSKQGYRQSEITTLEIEIPTDKKGLLDFLNDNEVSAEDQVRTTLL